MEITKKDLDNIIQTNFSFSVQISQKFCKHQVKFFPFTLCEFLSTNDLEI